MSYTPKDLVLHEEARTKLKSGIKKISEAVKSTLGPGGNTVVIESPAHTHGITVTKDGVTVAKAVQLLDPVENLAVQMMRESSQNTANIAGDGTTTAIVLAEAIVKEGLKHLTENNISSNKYIKSINEYTDRVIENLESVSKKLSKKGLLDVATISANNDKVLGKIIADTYLEVGTDGVVTVENSQNDQTFSEVHKGIQLKRGWGANSFVNNQKKDECVLDDCYVLLSDHVISNVLQIENVLKPIINGGHKLLIIASCSANVMNTLSANVVRNGLKLCQIEPPQFGYKRHELMNDIAVATGGKYFAEETGDDLNLIRMEDLGRIDKVIAGRDETIMIGGHGDEDVIKERVKELKVQKDNTKSKPEVVFMSERIACLNGAIGVIYVGGNSDIEQKEKYDRVDDAVCAVRSALDEGILPGGGVTLWREGHKLLDGEDVLAAENLSESMKAPLRTIMKNAGLSDGDIMEIEGLVGNSDSKMGYDVKDGMFGDMYKMGILDPLKVTKNALKNAVSVATTILSTNAIITMAREIK